MFRLVDGLGTVVFRPKRLAGKFDFTGGSDGVGSTGDMRQTLAAGDVLTPNGDSDGTGKKYFVESVDSAILVTLTEAFGEANQLGVNGFTDENRIWMTDTAVATELGPITPERFDGGSVFVTLANGKEVNRAEGFRVTVTFTWEQLEKEMMRRAVMLLNWGKDGNAIEVQPHANVKWKMNMNLVDWTPGFVGEKYVGHRLVMVFRSADLVLDIPEISSGLVIRPSINI